MSVFRKGDRWVAKFKLNGKQYWVPGGPWEKERHALEAELRHRDFITQRRSEETCRSFAERWMDEWPRPEAATNKLYRAAAAKFADHFGSTRLEEVRRMEARAWALGVPRSVSRVINTMYEDARNVGLVDTNPFTNLRLPTGERKAQIQPPTLEEYGTLIEACSTLEEYGPEFMAMIQFSAWTGIRQGEMFGLQWQDIRDDEITVARSRKADGRLGLPKNGLIQVMPFPAPARVLDTVPRRPDPFVFHSPTGKPWISKGTFRWSWQKVTAAAGLKTRWHDLRHFCATQLLEMGLSHFDVSIQLRHTDGGKLVMERYGHPSVDAAKRRVVDAFALEGRPSTPERLSKAAGERD